MTRTVRAAALVLAFVALLALAAGCKPMPKQEQVPAKVAPPAVKEGGKLRVGVDLSYPPFAGTDNGKQAGLDIDVANAVAGKLGLSVVVVDVKPSDAATALADGKVDAVFSVPLSEAALTSVSLAGSYVTDGPAFFIATDSTASVEPSLTLSAITASPIAAQQGSVAYWRLLSEFDEDGVKAYPELRQALTALMNGETQVVAGDALVGGYIIRDMPTVHLAGQLEPAMPLGVAVLADNTELGDAVRSALDELAADGVLETIRAKWVGELPKLETPASSETSDSVETTVAP